MGCQSSPVEPEQVLVAEQLVKEITWICEETPWIPPLNISARDQAESASSSSEGGLISAAHTLPSMVASIAWTNGQYFTSATGAHL